MYGVLVQLCRPEGDEIDTDIDRKSLITNFLKLNRRYCRVAVLDNCIYALGGFDSSNYQSSVERFDPRVGNWMPMPCMTSRRSSCGVAALDYLYCIGGSDGTMCMSSGERFNSRTNSWYDWKLFMP